MPRYIERESLLEQMDDTCKYAKPTNDYQRGCNEVFDWCAKIIKNMPTADVVPKSEVERLKICYEGSQKTIKGLTEMIREKNKELAKLETHLELHYGERSLNNLIAEERADVAREIFEKIYKSVASKIPTYIRPIFKDDLDFEDGFRNGKTDALYDVLVIIAELKKKYTENENG